MKKSKKPKKIRSIKHQITFTFIGLLFLSILTISMINGAFLEKYYVSKKTETLLEAREVLSQINTDSMTEDDVESEQEVSELMDSVNADQVNYRAAIVNPLVRNEELLYQLNGISMYSSTNTEEMWDFVKNMGFENLENVINMKVQQRQWICFLESVI